MKVKIRQIAKLLHNEIKECAKKISSDHGRRKFIPPTVNKF